MTKDSAPSDGRDAVNVGSGQDDLMRDALGQWVPPRSQIQERERVLAALRGAGFGIVRKADVKHFLDILAENVMVEQDDAEPYERLRKECG